jgi:hypothetical protein
MPMSKKPKRDLRPNGELFGERTNRLLTICKGPPHWLSWKTRKESRLALNLLILLKRQRREPNNNMEVGNLLATA